MSERKRLGLREVRALQAGEAVWDAAVPGFGARRQRDSVSYVLHYRTDDGRQRWHTIGRHGAPWTPEKAREEARRLLGRVVEGADPVAEKREKREALTVRQLCEEYLKNAEAGHVLVRGGHPKKAGTLMCDRGRIMGHVVPMLGGLKVAAVTRADVERLMVAIAEGKTAKTSKGKPRGVIQVRGGRGAASRTIGMLGGVFSYAVQKRYRADNPVDGVERYADGERKRRLSDDECRRLGAALRRLEGTTWPAVIGCARFLCLTGWRTSEALELRWGDVDLDRRTAILPDSKSGRSMRALSAAACDVLRGMARDGERVFPASRGDGPMAGFKKHFRSIVAGAELPADITPHVLRHSFASVAADAGYSELTIAALIGHRSGSVTSRYVHSADAVLLAAADAVASRIAELLDAEAVPAPANDQPQRPVGGGRERHLLRSPPGRIRHTLRSLVAV